MTLADGTVRILGTAVSRNTAYAGGAVVMLVIAVAVYRSRKASSAAASPAAPAADPSVDPGTGIPYAQEQAAAGSYAGGYSGGFGIGTASGFASGTGQAGGTTPVFTDNASWAQYAESYLTGLGADPNTTGNALGKYITGQPVTPDQQAIIEQAIAFANRPPVAGSGGFPPSMNLAVVPPPAPVPAPPGRTGAGVRRVATGHQSLADVAKSHNVSVASIVSVTRNSREISSANLAKFDAYIAASPGGAARMTAGLIYYTSN